MKFIYLIFISLVGCLIGVSACSSSHVAAPVRVASNVIPMNKKLDTAVFAAGCFWCTEAVFLQVKGVVSVRSGYMGGQLEQPSYEAVCTGTTGHAEVCWIEFDPEQVTYKQLLAAFFLAHDPTQLNRQGNDEGTQYRSAIFYNDATQKEVAQAAIQHLNEVKAYPAPIVTSLEPMATFYVAEDYHQNYYALNKNQPYCRFVIQPKLEKFKQVFK